jgi:hypothetical protein
MVGFGEIFRWTTFWTALGCFILAGCTEEPDGPPFALAHLGRSAPLPISGDNKLAVAGPDFACLFDSYEKQLACGDLRWRDTLRFGRSGKGPGELGDYGVLVTTSKGRVGFVDLPNDRISVFSRQGYAGQFPLPNLLTPASDVSALGTYAGYESIPTQSAGGITLQELRAESAEVIRNWRLSIKGTGADEQQVMVTGATRLRNGDFIVRTAVDLSQQLLLYAADGSFLGELKMPDLPTQLPDARDIEIFREGMTLFPPGPAVDRAVRRFSNQPMLRLPRNNLFRAVQLDPEGRVLVLTTARSPNGTYVEAYSDLEYVGRAHLRGRVLAIQVVDSILVSLSEEMPTEDFFPRQRLDWYGFGSSPSEGH